MTAHKWVPAVDAKAHFPRLIIRYLEGNLDCPPFQYSQNVNIMMTRALRKVVQRENISIDPMVKIARVNAYINMTTLLHSTTFTIQILLHAAI